MLKKLIKLTQKQKGSVLVEFALTAPIYFLILFGIIEYGRILYAMNLASEATRHGARVAAVCNMNATGIRNQMRTRMPSLTDQNITVAYATETGNTSCTQATCATVTVRVVGLNLRAFIPYAPFNLTLPSFSTTLPRESLSNGTGNDLNTLCTL